jgi:protein arginine kinase activator
MEEIERPLECGECRKPIHTHYTIINQNSIQRIGMCADCPILQRKLHGLEEHSLSSDPETKKQETRVCCGGCGLMKDDVTMGSRLGCPLCYEIFEDEIFHELIDTGHLPPKIKELKRTIPLHIGSPPISQKSFDPSIKLFSLQKELQETLKREDYEQAAWIRDKIQALTKKQKESNNGESEDTSSSQKS